MKLVETSVGMPKTPSVVSICRSTNFRPRDAAVAEEARQPGAGEGVDHEDQRQDDQRAAGVAARGFQHQGGEEDGDHHVDRAGDRRPWPCARPAGRSRRRSARRRPARPPPRSGRASARGRRRGGLRKPSAVANATCSGSWISRSNMPRYAVHSWKADQTRASHTRGERRSGTRRLHRGRPRVTPCRARRCRRPW